MPVARSPVPITAYRRFGEAWPSMLPAVSIDVAAAVPATPAALTNSRRLTVLTVFSLDIVVLRFTRNVIRNSRHRDQSHIHRLVGRFSYVHFPGLLLVPS